MTVRRAALVLVALIACDGLAEDAEHPRATFQTPSGPIVAAYELDGDHAIVQGDMLFPRPDAPAPRSSRLHDNIWTAGVIPYEIDPGLADAIPRIERAMAHWHARTWVRWVPRRGEANFVRFVPADRRCGSALGPGAGGERQIALDPLRCPEFTIIHELGHMAGLLHEHSRPDRDRYIRINWDNIAPEDRRNFDVDDRAIVHGPYDYASVMHYPAWGFAIDRALGSYTPRRPGVVPGGYELSAGDQAGVNVLYGFGLAMLAPDASLRPTSQAIATIGSLDGWPYSAQTEILHAANLDEAPGDELVVRRPGALGALRRLDGGKLGQRAMVAYGLRLGSFLVSERTEVFAAANVDADAPAELIVRNPIDGWGFLEVSGGSFRARAVWPWGTVVGGVPLAVTDVPLAATDLDRDGRAELVLRSASRLVVLSFGDDGQPRLRALHAIGAGHAWDTQVSVAAVGDLDGDGDRDLLLRDAAAISVVDLTSGGLVIRQRASYGEWLGLWHLGGDNLLGPTLDSDDDGRAEIVVRSGWGIGLLERDGAGRLVVIASAPVGGIAGWSYGTGDQIAGVLDWDHDGDDELVLGRPGAGLVFVQANAAAGLSARRISRADEILGDWRLDVRDRPRLVGDFDGDGVTELVVQRSTDLP